ncbi:unnamed protein product [Dibothriocephalus latus]|uniref:Uncharacterized protein n=1 Tax=Dibothriocephalus latus TaxID=60516 RepID=A0A3P6SHE3_DIBLA|nr:unnamed protein product [Dibothriocephalus latus]
MSETTTLQHYQLLFLNKVILPFQIVDYDDKHYSLDVWRAMLSNKSFTEYYLSKLEFSVVKYDKVTISNKPSTDSKLPFLRLAAGLAFRVDLEFNYLVTRFPNSQMAVGLVLFSNKSLSPTADFQNSRRYFSRADGTSRRYQVTDVKLGDTHNTGAFLLHAEEQGDRNLTTSTHSAAVFRPSPVCFYDKDRSKSGPVFTGPRRSLSDPRRRRLRGSLAKAIFGTRYKQQFHFNGKRDERRRVKKSKPLPIGMRLQYFAFGSPNDASLKSSKFLLWSSILSVVPLDQPTGREASDVSRESLMAWYLMALNWDSAVSSQLGS